MKPRKKFTPEFKGKREFKEKAALLYTKDLKSPADKSGKEKQKRYEVIGLQKVEIAFIKKASS